MKMLLSTNYKPFSKIKSRKNRAQLNQALYKMLNTENIAVYLIFTLVIVVALFNPRCIDYDDSRQKGNLKTLFNLGTEIKDLRKIFLLQGTLLSVFEELLD
jgi:lipoprotein-releasing system permease protein